MAPLDIVAANGIEIAYIDSEEAEKTVDYVLCQWPFLLVHMLRWIGIRFFDKLIGLKDCKLENLVDFINAFNWLVGEHYIHT